MELRGGEPTNGGDACSSSCSAAQGGRNGGEGSTGRDFDVQLPEGSVEVWSGVGASMDDSAFSGTSRRNFFKLDHPRVLQCLEDLAAMFDLILFFWLTRYIFLFMSCILLPMPRIAIDEGNPLYKRMPWSARAEVMPRLKKATPRRLDASTLYHRRFSRKVYGKALRDEFFRKEMPPPVEKEKEPVP